MNGGRLEVINAECRARLEEGDLGPFDACVTDPPYELGFMGKAWDKSGVAYDPATWAAILARLKPGAHLLAFAAPRTEHRIACAIEDAGFSIRDKLIWLYGQGFLKSLNIGKAIDKAAGAVREVVGRNPNARPIDGAGRGYAGPTGHDPHITAPATDAARQWDGWGTALKPAYEPIILARAPLDGTIVQNVIAHGTGGLNVKGCAIGTEVLPECAPGQAAIGTFIRSSFTPTPERIGRWPSNVLLDEEAAARLDAEAGDVGGSSGPARPSVPHGGAATNLAMSLGGTTAYQDAGGASRFFYTAKPSRSERDDGTGDLTGKTREQITGREEGSDGQNNPRAGRRQGGRIGNHHPTVKPVALMRWLIRLTCPQGGIILDPFMGSGTTLIAARDEFVRAVGIEQDAEFCEIAEARLRQGGFAFEEVG